MFVIETKGLTKKFGKLTAVNKINLKIEEGEIFGLLGPNGAGKTTTLSMLATLIPPTDGSASVAGHDVRRQASKVRQNIGFVFQDPSSDDLLTGRENLYLHAMMYGVDMKNINRKMDDVLKLVDLTDRQHDRMRGYSGGMRRRLELARGLLHDPKVLFLDEPTLGLDPQTREHLWSYIKRLSTEKKVTVIITTHYMDEAERLCNRVAIIDHGRIVALDTPNKLKERLGGDVVRLVVKKPNVAALKKLKYVKGVKVSDGAVTLTAKDAGRHLQEILNKAGSVESVESHSPTLNDVFLHLTGSEIREQEGEGGYLERMMHSGNR
ncbi:MAG: ATP-binding cassette domain-containing protein [Candidatus Micrarchaeota archaeon]|nr:ATP-binding cassette domain-containing protein [Candidatus Micrarchaeota archaeon]MDE1847005.1 ATP-binding cassette domain-containing protein [Candidatus Micrarchaeota archaeon]